MINILLFLGILAVIFYLSNTYNWAKILFRVVLGVAVAILVVVCIWLAANADNL